MGQTRWRARVKNGGVERSRTFDRLEDARKWAATEEADMARGTWIDPHVGRQTFGDYARAWQEIQVHRPTTASKVESALRLHILPFFESRPIASIKPSVVQQWVKTRSGVLAPSTLEIVAVILRQIFNAAVVDQIITSSPCRGMKLPRKPKNEVVPPTTADVEAILAALPDRYRAIAVVAAGAGLRSGEILGLTVDRVDFLRGRALRVDQQLVTPNKGALYMGPPKTEAGYRAVPVPSVVLDALAAHLAQWPAVEHELLDLTSGKDEGDVRRHRLVFTNSVGKPIRRNNFHDIWRAAITAAGVDPGIGLHDLRHYYASLLIRHGENVKVVQARLGHASAQETLDTYGHLWEDNEDRTRDAVQEVLGGLAIGVSPRAQAAER